MQTAFNSARTVFETTPLTHINSSSSFSQTVLVDSRCRDINAYPDPSTYRISLPKTLRNVTSARLVSAEVPGTFYVFRQVANNLTLRVIAENPLIEKDIVIPEGNYSATTIGTTLETLINEAFAADGLTFTVTVDRLTMKLVIECTSSPTRVVGVDCSPGVPGVSDQTIGWGLGFNCGFDKGKTVGTGKIQSAKVVNFLPENFMLLSLGRLDNVDVCGGTEISPSRCFAKIPFNINSYEVVFLDRILSDNIINPSISRLDTLDVSFRWNDGTPVDFNGVDHSFTVEFVISNIQAA